MALQQGEVITLPCMVTGVGEGGRRIGGSLMEKITFELSLER